jgi:hypothetical protein
MKGKESYISRHVRARRQSPASRTDERRARGGRSCDVAARRRSRRRGTVARHLRSACRSTRAPNRVGDRGAARLRPIRDRKRRARRAKGASRCPSRPSTTS